MKSRLIAPLTAAVLVATAWGQPQPDERAPEPTVAQQADAEKLIKEVYKDEYLKRGIEERKALAQRLLTEGKNTRSDPPSHYVLLREARDIAIAAGDYDTAIEAADELGRSFKIDTSDSKLKVLTGLRQTAKTPEANVLAAEACLQVIDQALASENFEAAGRAVELAAGFATAGKNIQQVADVQARKTDVKSQSTAFMEMKIAQDKLKATPGDPIAKFTFGSYLGMYKNDWDKALPYLADCADPNWAAAAKLDIAGGTDLTTRMRVGDAWWELAYKGTTPKLRILSRAEVWYKAALPDADGLIKAKLDKRLETIESTKVVTQNTNVGDATRKLLPTTAEMTKIKEIAASLRTNSARREELLTLIQQIQSRLTTDIYLQKENDYFARLKADANVRRAVEAQGQTSLLNYYSPLWQTLATYFSQAKTREEVGARILAAEKFNGTEKIVEKVTFDNYVYNGMRNFMSSHYTMFPATTDRVDFCIQVQKMGVKSDGVIRVRALYDRTITAPQPGRSVSP